jgi:ubiquinone/menaquinone biosynthesis C-methylase UbiE
MTEQTATYRGRFKYDEKTARKYQKRPKAKHEGEMKLVDRAFALVPKSHRVLDVPCGGGRIAIHLAKKGYATAAADLSDSMIQITRENVAANKLDCAVEKQDVEKMTLPDKAYDTLISFRLFHHFPTVEIRRRVVHELCRVARKYVALSYFSPYSPTSVRNKVRAALGGKRSLKHTTSLSEVEGYFKEAGFKLVKDFAQLPLLHTVHLGLFERVGESRP